MASRAADFSEQLLWARSGRPRLAGLSAGAEPAKAHLNPGRGASPIAAPSAQHETPRHPLVPRGAQVVGEGPRPEGSASREDHPRGLLAQGQGACTPDRAHLLGGEACGSGDSGSHRLPVSWEPELNYVSNKQERGPSALTVSDRPRGSPTGGLCPARLGEDQTAVTPREGPAPAPKDQSWALVFFPSSWWPAFRFPLQGRKDHCENLRERTKALATPKPPLEPESLPSLGPGVTSRAGYHLLSPCQVPSTLPSFLSSEQF